MDRISVGTTRIVSARVELVCVHITTPPKAANHRFFTKIIKIHRIWTPYESGSDRSPRNRQKSQVHVRCKALPCSFRLTLPSEHKSSTKTSKFHTPDSLDPPTSPFWFCGFGDISRGRPRRDPFNTPRRGHM